MSNPSEPSSAERTPIPVFQWFLSPNYWAGFAFVCGALGCVSIGAGMRLRSQPLQRIGYALFVPMQLLFCIIMLVFIPIGIAFNVTERLRRKAGPPPRAAVSSRDPGDSGAREIAP